MRTKMRLKKKMIENRKTEKVMRKKKVKSFRQKMISTKGLTSTKKKMKSPLITMTRK